MRLAIKTAGLCGTGVFLILTYTSVFRQIDLMDVIQGNQITMEPVTALLICLSGGIMAALVGFLIGDIFAKPRGSAPTKKGQKSEEAPTLMTGDQTFLDDLGEMPTTTRPEASLEPAAEPASDNPAPPGDPLAAPPPQPLPEEQNAR